MTAALATHASAPHPVAPRDGHVPGEEKTPRRPRLVPVPDFEPPLTDDWATSVDSRTDPRSPRSSAPVRPAGHAAPTAQGAAGVATSAPDSQSPPSPPAIHRYHVPALPGRHRTLPARGSLPPRRRRFQVQKISATVAPGPPAVTPAGDTTDIPGVRAALAAAGSPRQRPPLPRTPRPALDTGTMLSRAIIEALSGCRPIRQLEPYCAPGVFTGVEDLPMLGGRRNTHLVGTWVCEPAPGIAEVSAAFRCDGLTRAMAFRLERAHNSWRITQLQLG